MIILSYIHIIVNIYALLPFIICKAPYSSDFLINTPYFVNIKKDPPLDLPIYKITICGINKISYNKHKNL